MIIKYNLGKKFVIEYIKICTISQNLVVKKVKSVFAI